MATVTELGPNSSSASESDSPRRGVTVRSVAVGFVLSVGCGIVVPYMDHYVQGTFIGGQHLPPGAVFMLMLLVLVLNPLLRLLSPRLPFARAELLVIYTMLLISTLVPSHGSESVFVPVSVSAFYYATPANGWASIFFQYVPTWLHPTSDLAIKGFYEGLPPGVAIPWSDWIIPFMAWGVLLVVLYLLATFASALFYPQWANYERLSFPLVALPMQMTQNPSHPLADKAFWGNPVMWIGFGLTVLVQGLAGLRFYYPSVGGIRMEWAYTPQEGIGQFWGWTPFIIYPAVIGVSMLLRTEVAFSIVGFFLFNRVQRLVGGMLGFRAQGLSIAGYPLWLGAQPWGGYVAYIGLTFWSARRHLAGAWAELTGKAPATEEGGLSYRTCLIGIGLCLAAATWWLVVAGMSLWTAAFVILVYTMIIIILSKVVAEVGLLFVQQTVTPVQALNYLFGTNTVGARSLTAGMFFERAYSTDLRATIGPSLVQGLRIAEEGGISRRQMFMVLWVALAASVPTTAISQLWLYYRHGAAGMNQWFCHISGTGGWDQLSTWLSRPEPPNLAIMVWMAIGAVFVLGVSAMRQRYLWFWPHPVGFIMMQTHPVAFMWFSIMISAIIKSALMRYGGPQVMRKALPFFLGLAFGDVFMMILWRIVDAMVGAHGHFLLPG
ncbi:MAG TPA: DUF6785 family protein [Armatimonadota bacterium]|jgi:hypothetical protein